MRIPQIDLRTPDQKAEPKKISRFAVFFIVCLISVGALAFSTNVIFSDHPVVPVADNTFLGQVRTLVRSADRALFGEKDDRINILILGIGGEGHDGPQLTDTVILASFKPSTNTVSLLSIPRDLQVSTDNFGLIKLNAINAYAEAKEKGSGPGATAEALATALGQPVSYWARIDFKGFEKGIDALGGVDVTVDRSFTDDFFPTDDGAGTVKAISFKAGLQHMDGKTALEFARSRHGTNGEGSDFARSRRQEKILMAAREKMLSAGTLLNPFTINKLFDTVKSSFVSNLRSWELIRFAREAADVKSSDVGLRVMSDENVLEPRLTAGGAFVLLPKNGDWSLVQQFAETAFTAPTEPAKQEPIKVEVQNGTLVPGLAQRKANELMAAGLTVVRFGNAPERGYEKSVIYDLTKGAKADSLAKIRTIIDANVAPSIPASVVPPTDADFIVILGKNASL